MVVAARRIVTTGPATISADGGMGARGNTGGGGGGAVVLITTSLKPSDLTLSAAGGTPAGQPGRTLNGV